MDPISMPLPKEVERAEYSDLDDLLQYFQEEFKSKPEFQKKLTSVLNEAYDRGYDKGYTYGLDDWTLIMGA